MTGGLAAESSRIGDWRAARHFPDSYPGECPPASFVVVDGDVLRIEWGRPGDLDSLQVVGAGGLRPLDELLRQRDLPTVSERVPVVAYGGNRNPGTIALKCDHYRYRSPGEGKVFPALRARLRGFDVVGSGLCDQGYLYADLYLGERTARTEIDVWLLLLDHDGVRMMHDSEGLRGGAYVLAVLDEVSIDGRAAPVPALGYAGLMPVFESPVLGAPVAYSTVGACHRTLPAFDAVGMLGHAVEALGLTGTVTELTGIAPGPGLAAELMKYLNGQFWYRRHTGRERLLGAERLEQVMWAALSGTWAATSTAELLGARGRTVDVAAAYEPPIAFQVANWW